MPFWSGFAVGLVVGSLAGVLLVRYGMALHERIHTGAVDGRPVFGKYAVPIAQSRTGGDENDDELDELE